MILTRDGRVKILDFGLAGLRGTGTLAGDCECERRAAQHDHAGSVRHTRLHRPGAHRGRVARRALRPVLARRACSTRCSRAQPAFDGATAADVAHRHHRARPARDRAAAARLALDRIVRRALEKDPAQRFQSASDLAYALEAISFVTGARLVHRRTAHGAPLVALVRAGRARRVALAGAGVGDRLAHLAPAAALLPAASPSATAASRRRASPADGDTIVYSAVWDGLPKQSMFTARTDMRGARPAGRRGPGRRRLARRASWRSSRTDPTPRSTTRCWSPGSTLATRAAHGRRPARDPAATSWRPTGRPGTTRTALGSPWCASRTDAAGSSSRSGARLYQTAYGLRAPRFSPVGRPHRGDREPDATATASASFDLEGGRKVLTAGHHLHLLGARLGARRRRGLVLAPRRWRTGPRYGSWRPGAARGEPLGPRAHPAAPARVPEPAGRGGGRPRADDHGRAARGGRWSSARTRRPRRNLSWHEGVELRRAVPRRAAGCSSSSRPSAPPTCGRPLAARRCGCATAWRWASRRTARWVARIGMRLYGPPGADPDAGRRDAHHRRPAHRALGHRTGSATAVRLLITGNEEGRPAAGLGGGHAHAASGSAITPEGVGCWLVSPDGRTAACARPGAEGYFYPVDGGDPRPLHGFRGRATTCASGAPTAATCT